VLAHLGEVLFSLGQMAEAEELLRTSLDLGCENPEVVEDLLSAIGPAAGNGADDD
jgi:hypothetical protein